MKSASPRGLIAVLLEYVMIIRQQDSFRQESTFDIAVKREAGRFMWLSLPVQRR